MTGQAISHRLVARDRSVRYEVLAGGDGQCEAKIEDDVGEFHALPHFAAATTRSDSLTAPGRSRRVTSGRGE